MEQSKSRAGRLEKRHEASHLAAPSCTQRRRFASATALLPGSICLSALSGSLTAAFFACSRGSLAVYICAEVNGAERGRRMETEPR